jgi:hypothetical protein
VFFGQMGFLVFDYLFQKVAWCALLDDTSFAFWCGAAIERWSG